MRALEFWKAVTVDRSDFLDRVIDLLQKNHVRFCVVGGQAVNAYAEPVVSIDLDIAVAVQDLPRATALMREQFDVRDFPHSINVAAAGSDLRVQLQKDARYAAFPDRAKTRDVLGFKLPVASIDDVMRGKIWAAQDSERRGSKRQKDLADIARLLESDPDLRPLVPQEILDRLF